MIPKVQRVISSLAIAALLTSASVADRVRTLDGSISGEVIAATPLGVTLQRNGNQEEISDDQIKTVIYEDEPAELSQARLSADNGAYVGALEKLEEVSAASIEDPRILEDLAFYKAYCASRLAIAGKHDPGDAGRELTAYVRKYKESYHYFRAVQSLGDLWVSLGKPKNAEKMYRLLAKAKAPSVAIRGALLIGKMKQAEGDHQGALQAFNAAMKQPTDSPTAAAAHAEAALGQGVSLASTGSLDKGLAAVRKVIRAADVEDEALRAKAYNALGLCYLAAEKPGEALFAYLHVDTLFNSQADQHAEALFHLVSLWQALDKPEEAKTARGMLQGRYAQTSWARKDKERSNKG